MKKILSILIVIAALLFAAPTARAYEGYPDPEAMYGEIHELEEEFPDFVEVGEYGKSLKDRPLLYVRIARPDGETRPQAMIAANIHGNEWIGNRIAMAAARRLLEDNASDAWIASLLDRIEFFILPCLNPDGYYKTWEMRNDKNPPWADMRKNANGVDPNRNFPLPAERTLDIDIAGSDDPGHIRYTGPHPYSEPESRAIGEFVAQHDFFASIDFHSSWGTFFPPKCNSSACEKQFKKIMEAARERQKHSLYTFTSAWQVDTFTGEMEDMLFYEHGIMAVCWEIFTEKAAREQRKDPALKHPFWSMNPHDIGLWVENDADAALAAIEKALEITGGKPIPEKYRKTKLK